MFEFYLSTPHHSADKNLVKALFSSILHRRRAADCGRSILIGSDRSVRYLRNVLRHADSPIKPIGCVLLQRGGPLRSRLSSLRLLGTIDELDVITRAWRVETAYISIPMAMDQMVGHLTMQLRELGVKVHHLPTLNDQLEGQLRGAGRLSSVIDPNQLTDRPHVPLDDQAIRRTLTGKRVMITGAGGSIGSEMARIVARYDPAEMLLMERAENNLFEIDRTLGQEFPDLTRTVILHDVSDAPRTGEHIARYRPHAILHAAAHKHVPMMEGHPRAAVNNNFFGTKSIADAAAANNVERFVMISTDKAVNPTSVMGVTKRVAERYVQYLDTQNDTIFSIVRFGNVLGSACSVVPIWTQQLSSGGPITVTDPRMTRFFMTIREAAELVIQAASLSDAAGAVFVLDMGQPIRIVDLAKRFVELHGLKDGCDVDIVFTGARPGEKLHEELSYGSEDMLATAHSSVRRLRTAAPNDEYIRWLIPTLGRLRNCDFHQPILDALRRAVPEMQSNGLTDVSSAQDTPPMSIDRIARTA